MWKRIECQALLIDDFRNLLTQKLLHSQWRTQGGEGGEDSPPPEIGKIVVEIWCYLAEVHTFGAESEIQEIFSKNCEKTQFSI